MLYFTTGYLYDVKAYGHAFPKFVHHKIMRGKFSYSALLLEPHGFAPQTIRVGGAGFDFDEVDALALLRDDVYFAALIVGFK